MTKLRVALHFATLSAGGVERMRLNLARTLLAAKFDVDLVLCRASGDLIELVPPTARVIDLSAQRTIHSLPGLIRYLLREKPYAMISSLGHQNLMLLAAKIITRSKSKIIVTQHNSLSDEAREFGNIQHRVLPLLYRIFLRFADHVVCVSSGVADDLSEMTGYPRDQISVIYDPSIDENHRELSNEPVEEDFFCTDDYIVLGVGRLHPQKSFDVLIQAVAEASKSASIRLAIVGDGPQRDELNRLAEDLGIGSRFKTIGFRSNPFKYMKRADLLCVSSMYEGFGNVLVEALACGTPVISTDCRFGPREILNGGEFGILVPVGDASALSQAILSSLNSTHDTGRLIARSDHFGLGASNNYISLILSGVSDK